MTKPLASLSLDLDNEWLYRRAYGDDEWRSLHSYFDVAVPRVLDFLAKRECQKITFFVVGQDAALKKNEEAIASIARAGHDIGNHSFHHDPCLHLQTPLQIADELESAEWHIERITGQRPIGFRGPGCGVSDALLMTLAKLGYQYDASSLPTFGNGRFGEPQRHDRRSLFGSVRDALRPLAPYRWGMELDGGGLVEIPITTMPLFRAPIHFSAILGLSCFSRPLALAYYRTALKLCELSGTQPSMVLHPLDFMGQEDIRALKFLPGMGVPGEQKLELIATLVDDLRARYRVVPMIEHARAAAASKLPIKELAYSS